MHTHEQDDLKRIYAQRFSSQLEYRNRVWSILVDTYFTQYIPKNAAVLDLGCGYGEFINHVEAALKYGMDLNPDSSARLNPEVNFLFQDCSLHWQIPDHTLDIVFTSNFFEHLPDKSALGKTLDEARRCLKPGGRIIAMGPNIKFLPGAYWDFWDHHLALTELSLREALENRGFTSDLCIDRFLPYTMANKKPVPEFLIKTYLAVRPAWRLLGKQFLVIARS